MSVRIGLGIAGFPFSSPRAFLEWVDLCEDSPIDSIWLSERLVSTQLQLEPMTAFGVIAGRTERIKFGMNAVVLPFRDPLVLAKECATLDFLSDGRLLPAFGVGGEAAPEFRATGRQPVGRGAYSDEMLDIMVRLWEEDGVSHAGKHFQYENASVNPKPVQQPLPVWIGGSSDAAIRRTARIGTGWLAGLQSPAQVAPVVQAIREQSESAGRPLDPDHYGAGFPFRFGSWDEPGRRAHGSGLSQGRAGHRPGGHVRRGRRGGDHRAGAGVPRGRHLEVRAAANRCERRRAAQPGAAADRRSYPRRTRVHERGSLRVRRAAEAQPERVVIVDAGEVRHRA
ncbi:MAG: TIGR03619 family F420-dependent LLM class oxidoreductase [Dehalococcoidia bacterium]|nr:TIGR03619 family F420-dependent LLM class oxidoreductase [Dehalococcoidia bacterium]